jgi:rhodanese-related sulfurtransferase
LGVRATPTFFIDRQKIEGPLEVAQFSQLIDQELASHSAAVAQNAEPTARPDTPATFRPPGKTVPAASTADAPPRSPGLLGMRAGGIFSQFQTSSGACSEAEAAKQQPVLIDTAQTRQLIAGNPKPVIVDVRPAKDFAQRRIPGAINIPVDNLETQWNKLPKDRTIILYESGRAAGDVCAASRAAGRILLAHGFLSDHVKVYQEGLAGWEKAGMPVEP